MYKDEPLQMESIGNVDFVNLVESDISPLISKCQIKVFYLGKNRNGSYIDKDAADKMAKTLRTAPIVGYWRDDKDDFSAHGDVITIGDDGEINISSKVTPYGFVDSQAPIWYEDWIEDGVKRTYLMTEGYLWTGQFPKIQKILEGRPQSMELDAESLEGHWADVDVEDTDNFNNNESIEFFIINNSVIKNLCILGEDTAPCFEGSNITAKFSNDAFVDTIQEMAKQLKFALENGEEGGKCMPEANAQEVTDSSTATPETQENISGTENYAVLLSSETKSQTVRSKAAEPEVVEEAPVEPVKEENVEFDEEVEEGELEAVTEVVAENDAEEFSTTESIPASEERDPSSNTNGESPFSAQIEAMQAELDELREFKRNIDREKKMEIVDRYHMLSDEDKQPVIDKLDDYSNLEIEKELAYIYVQRNVDFNTIDGQPERTEVENQEDALTTFSLDNIDNGEAVGDELLEALRSTANIL